MSASEFKPYVGDDAQVREFTPKAIILGALFGVIFGASTVYLALKAGLTVSASIPIAVGESMYSLSQFKDYMQAGACSIVQTDVARIGGITPWLKVAHMAEGFNIPVRPHFLMELHLGLCCAIPNSRWLEFIPQLDLVTHTGIRIENGVAFASQEPGLGIDWNWEALDRTVSARQAHGSW